MKVMLMKAMVMVACFLGTVDGWSQDRKITGKVSTAEDGTPLATVNISIKGKPGGTQTLADGTYSILVSKSDVLVFTYVGYATTEKPVDNNSIINVSMTTLSKQLEDVVVVGYGTQLRSNVTSSIAKLDKEVLASAPRANIGSALQGTISGLQVVNATGQPGASPLIVLRGGASINSPGSPLVVVDGIVRSYSDIPSEDIGSVELLKDAAATAIYGARANNGVILITTKQGKSGSAQVSYKFTGGNNRRRDGYNYMGARDFIYYNRLGNLNSGRTLAQVNSSRGYGLLTGAADLASFDIRAYSPATANLLTQGWDTVGDPYGGTIIFKDHGKEVENLVFQNTYTQDHYINVTGGNERGKYFTSLDYYKEDGVIVGSGYKRFSGNINGSYKIKPNLEIGSGVTLSTSSQIGVVGSEVNTLYRTMAIWPTFNPWLDAEKTLPNPGNGINDGNTLYWLGKRSVSDEVNRITANASVKWDLLPGLYLNAKGSVYLFEQLDQSFNKATQLYANIFTTPPSFSSTSRNSAASFSRSFQQQYYTTLNYNKKFKNKHNLDAMLGAEYYGTKQFDMQTAGSLAPTDDIPTVNAATTFVAGSNYTTVSEYRIVSAFGSVNYNYDQRYLLSFVFRNDGVSSLPEKNKFGFFPGMSVGWNIHKEKFFVNSAISNVVTNLKARASYGQNGNVSGLGRYEVQGGYGSQGLYNNNSGFLNTGIINNNLRWEKSKSTDLGLDIGLLNNKLTLMVDYYDRITSDLITNLSLPSYVGFGSVRTNLGTYQNKGFEISVNANLLNKPNGLRLDVSANASFVKNKILQLPYNGNDKNRQGGMQVYDPVSGQVIWVGGLQEGEQLGEIYAFKQLGIFSNDAEIAKLAGTRRDLVAGISGPNVNYGSGKITPGDVNWMDVDKNDTIDSRDQVRIGNINPKWTGGFSANLSFKGFSLYSRFEFALGHTIYNDLVARTLGNYQGTFNYFDLQKNAWSPTNTNTDIPKVYYADQVAAPLGKKNYTRINNAGAVLNSNNSRFYEKGDYLACREITLSYDLPKSVLSKTKFISQARIYTSVSNLFYITKFSGPSPEPPVSGGVVSGVYVGTYPTPKTFVLGVQVSF